MNTPDMVKIYSNGAGGGNGPASGSGGAGGECATFRKLPTFIEVSGNDGATPDTEVLKTCRDCNHWISGEETYACNDCIKSLISSRDTYWKERVRKEVEKLKQDEKVVRSLGQDRTLYGIVRHNRALDTLLDNLK